MEKFSANKANLDKIADNNGIIIISRTLHKLISRVDTDAQQKNTVVECEISCAILAARFASKGEAFKEKVKKSNIIQLLMHAHSSSMNESMSKEAMASYGNFAYDYVEGIELMNKQGIVKLIEKGFTNIS